jgi:hypothetical protein
VRRFNDLTGRLFGSLKVLAYAGTDRHGRRKWRVCCARCGDQKIVLAANLLSGRTKTCGCIARLKAHLRMKTLMLSEKFAAATTKGMTFEEAKAELGL